MATIASLIVQIGTDTAQLVKGVDDVHTKLDRVNAIAGTVGKALSAAFTVTAIIGATKQVLDHAGALTDLSAKTGISTTGLQKFDLAFKQSGVSMETVSGSVTKLANAIVGGDKSAVGALEKMGLSVTALKGMAPEQQFTVVADAIGKIPNPTEKAYAAMQVFGKGGAELLKGLDGHLAETTKHFEDMGLVMSEETVAAADQFGDQLGLMGSQLMALVAAIIGPLLPALSGLMNMLSKLAAVVGPLIGQFVEFVQKGILSAWSAITSFLASIAEAATRIPFLGKHLGMAGDAAEWLRKSAASADAFIVKMGTSTAQAGKQAQVSTPQMMGFGNATERMGTSAEKAAEKLAKLRAEQLAQAREMERGSDMLVSFGFDPAAIQRQFGQAFQPEQMWSLGAKVGDQVGKGIWSAIPQTVTQNAPALEAAGTAAGSGLLSGIGKLFKGGSFGPALTSLFTGGGISGALTQGLSQAIGMGLNAIVPGLGALAGPLMAGVKKLWSGIKSLFGGPDAQEMEGRNAAGAFKAQVESMLSDAQKLELAQNNVSGALEQQVALHIKIRDAAQAAGLSRVEADTKATALVKQLWEAEKQGGSAVQQVIEQINQTIQTSTVTAVETAENAALTAVSSVASAGMTAAQQMAATWSKWGFSAGGSGGGGGSTGDESENQAFSQDWARGFVRANGIADIARIAAGGTINNAAEDARAQNWAANWIADHPGMVEQAAQENRDRANDNGRFMGFATGTGGRFLDFGSGTPVTLHGRERVMTEAEGARESGMVSMMAAELSEIRMALKRLPKDLTAAMQTAV